MYPQGGKKFFEKCQLRVLDSKLYCIYVRCRSRRVEMPLDLWCERGGLHLASLKSFPLRKQEMSLISDFLMVLSLDEWYNAGAVPQVSGCVWGDGTKGDMHGFLSIRCRGPV